MSFNGLDVVNEIEARVKLAEKAKASSSKNVKAAEATLRVIHAAFEGVQPLLCTVKHKSPRGTKDKLIIQTSKNVQWGYERAKQTVDNALREYEEASKDLEEAQATLVDLESKVSILDLTTPVKECAAKATVSEVQEDDDTSANSNLSICDLTTPVKECPESVTVSNEQKDHDSIRKAGDNVSIFDVYSFIIESSLHSSVNGLYKRKKKREKNGAPVFRNQHGYELWKTGAGSWNISRNDVRVVWCYYRPDGSHADPLHDKWAFDSRLKLTVKQMI